MDLSTTYLGFELSSPLVPGAGPLADTLDSVRRLEDAGAPMITLRSLFEEQLLSEQSANLHTAEATSNVSAEATEYLPCPDMFLFGSETYLEHLRRIKECVRVPVVASLNGTTLGGWLAHSELMRDAGADAIELNIYELATDTQRGSRSIEEETVEMVRRLKREVKLPVAVKLSQFFTALPHFVSRLAQAGADAVVIFNRFYQPDIDIQFLRVMPVLHLSDPSELLLRLRWTAILYGRVETGLAVTGGVHTPADAAKAILCGASATQLVSVLLRHGPQYLHDLRRGLVQWMEEHGYESVRQMLGTMSHANCPDPKGFERANYMQILQSWRISAEPGLDPGRHGTEGPTGVRNAP